MRYLKKPGSFFNSAPQGFNPAGGKKSRDIFRSYGGKDFHRRLVFPVLTRHSQFARMLTFRLSNILLEFKDMLENL